MTAHEALVEVRRLGGRLVWRDGDRLVVEAPHGALSPELAAALRRNRERLKELLRTEAGSPPGEQAPLLQPLPPPPSWRRRWLRGGR